MAYITELYLTCWKCGQNLQ